VSGLAGRLRAGWAGVTGTGAAASIALALLVFACTFIAAYLPRTSLTSRTAALQQTLTADGQLSRSVTASALAAQSGINDVDTIDGFWPVLARDLGAAGLRPAPQATGWAGFTTLPIQLAGAPGQLELGYRSTLAGNTRLVAGAMPATVVTVHHRPIFQIAVTQETAAALHVGVGSALIYRGGELLVTGVLRPDHPAAAFWAYDPLLLSFNSLAETGGAFIGAGEVGALENLDGDSLTWNFPLLLGRVTASQAPAFLDRLEQAEHGGYDGLSLSSPLNGILAAFISTDDGIATVLALLFVSLTVLGLIVILQGARLLSEHRAAEFAIMRARGASLRRLCWLALRGGSIVAVPAAAAALAAAVAARPGPGTALEWRLAVLILAVALAGPPVITLRSHWLARGLDRPGQTPGRRVLSARRWVADIGLVCVAAGSLIVLRQLGPPPSGGVNVYASAAPALAAIPAAIIAMRAYPFVLRWLLRLTRRRRGVTLFVGLARGERTALSTALPVFALVLALAIVAFGATLRTAVQRADVLASWQDTGADAVLTAQPGSFLSPALRHSVAAVPGVQRTATAVLATGSAGDTYSIPVVVVDPARYGALVAGTPAPAFPAAALARPRAGHAVPVLISPPARALLDQFGGALGVAGRALDARIAGVIPAIALVPGGGPFIVVPSWALPVVQPNAMVLTGSRLEKSALAGVVRRAPAPSPVLRLRSAQLAALANAPLPRSAYFTSLLSLACTVGFSVLSLLLALVLGARSRDLTQARLATMGISRRQARLLGVVESVPAIVVAAAGGIGCVLALTPLLGPAISLSAFTGLGLSAPFRANPLALAGSAAGLVGLAVLTIIIQVALASRRGPARALRVGE
jgi:putative ABC transport system permease protein